MPQLILSNQDWGCQDYKECTAILQPRANGDKMGGGVPLIFWMFRLTFGTEWHTELHLCVTWERCLCSLSHIGVGRGKVGIFDKNKPQQVQRV